MVKICKNCRRIYEEIDKCPQCPDGLNMDFSDRYNSSVLVLDASKSEIAQKLDFKTAGLYAIKVK
ncbi:MAG: transcription elongation factor subunit Spt4 [Candidatus Micrarchaeia archaeon]